MKYCFIILRYNGLTAALRYGGTLLVRLIICYLLYNECWISNIDLLLNYLILKPILADSELNFLLPKVNLS